MTSLPLPPLVIVGAGGFGREVAWLAQNAVEPFQVHGFVDDREGLTTDDLDGHRYLGPIDTWPEFEDMSFVVAVGDPRVRCDIVCGMLRNNLPRFATLIHSSSLLGPNTSVAQGSLICAGSVLTSSITVGAQSIVNLGVTVGHDANIGDFCTLAPQVSVSGNVDIGDGAEIGTSASLRQNVCVGRGAMLGMGSVLTKDIPDDSMFFGAPAKRVRSLQRFVGPGDSTTCQSQDHPSGCASSADQAG
jgi:sugar O-acyltransferase (sialic acid O-acetyltransferase NeuD family)